MQEFSDSMKALKQSIVSSHSYDIEMFDKKIKKTFDQTSDRIKICEVYC